MKKIFLGYLQKQLEKNNAMLASNSLSEEDRKLVEDAIADLERLTLSKKLLTTSNKDLLLCRRNLTKKIKKIQNQL